MTNTETVVIVDDDEIALLMLKSAFELAGFNVITTLKSSKIFDLYIKHKPVAVIVDIFMPDKDGIEVITEFKKRKFDALFIAISSHLDYLEIIKDFGADYAFSKQEPVHRMVDVVLNR